MVRPVNRRHVAVGVQAVQIQILQAEADQDTAVPAVFHLFGRHALNGFVITAAATVMQTTVGTLKGVAVQIDRFLLAVGRGYGNRNEAFPSMVRMETSWSLSRLILTFCGLLTVLKRSVMIRSGWFTPCREKRPSFSCTPSRMMPPRLLAKAPYVGRKSAGSYPLPSRPAASLHSRPRVSERVAMSSRV